MLTLSSTDVLKAKAATAAKVNCHFDGVTIDPVSRDETYGGLPSLQLADALGVIWAATAGMHVVRMIFKNTDVADQAVEVRKNGNADANILVAFVIPAGGGAVFSGGALNVWAANGVPAT